MSDLKLDGLNQILRSLRDADSARVKVGILGEKTNRRDNVAKPGKKFKGGPLSVLTNAEIGLIHEFGDPAHNLPVRSFYKPHAKSRNTSRRLVGVNELVSVDDFFIYH